MDKLQSLTGGGVPSFNAPSMPSGPFTDDQMETMRTETKDILDRFEKVYLRNYKTELIKRVKAELQPAEHPWKLRQVPDASAPVVVFTGNAWKRGAIIRNWKKRVFVVKSNGSVDYFAKEGDTKPKGSIVLEGYSVNSEPKLDVFAGKEHFFTFEHYDEAKRTWYLYCDSAEEKLKAVAAFTQAARVATGYINPDQVAGAAFKKAYASLRGAYLMYAKNPRGTEEDALADLVYDRIYHVLVADVVRPLTGPAKAAAVKTARAFVTTVVSAAWKAMCQVVNRVRPSLEETLKKAMEPFVENENKVKEKIMEQIGEKYIDPVATKVLAPFFSQIVGVVYPVVLHALVTQLEISIERLDKAVGEITPETEGAVLKELRRHFDISPATNQLPLKEIEAWLHRVEEVLRVVGGLEDFAGLATRIRAFVNDTLKPAVHLVYPASIEETMLKIAKNTAYTFDMDYKESPKAKEVAASTASKLEHDLRHLFTTVVRGSLQGFVHKPYEDLVVEPATELIKPIADTIPEELKDFIDPEALLQEILEETVSNAINEAATPGIRDLAVKLLNILEKKNIPAIRDD